MNRKSLIFVLPLIALVLMACRVGNVNINQPTVSGSGIMQTEQRTISNVDRVSMQDIGDLIIIQGNEEGLTVEADKNVMPYVETTMHGDELQIGLRNAVSYHNIGKITYTLKVKDLSRVAVSGSSNVRSDKLNVNDLALDVSGLGNVEIADLQAQTLSARISGSGNFDMKGNVQSQNITVSGAGYYKAADLKSGQANLTISGAGSMDVWTTDKLDVHVSGFGNVNYYGHPSVSQSITGGGSVKSLGEHE